MDITKNPTTELLNDKYESLVDFYICEWAILLGIIEKIDTELERRVEWGRE